VSKTLFPTPNRATATKFAERGNILRELVAVEDSSPLHWQERALRNHLEHLDERFEQWWLDDPSHNIARHQFGPLGQVVSGVHTSGMFEQFDPVEFVLAFQGDVYELRPVMAELTRLTHKSSELLATHWVDWQLPTTSSPEDEGTEQAS
jgi:hypothetical protein